MRNKIFIIGLCVLFISTAALSQYNFDSIKICHNKDGELKFVDVGEYEVKIQNGVLLSLSSKDDVVKYEEDKKLFTIKNLSKGSFLKVQLSNEGPIINTKDTLFVLSSPGSVQLESSNKASDAQALYSIGDFSFALEFKDNKISRISFASTGKYIAINLVQIKGIYTWDFGIESTSHANMLLMTYVFNKPYLLSINDDSNKVGLRLLSQKKNGIFNLVEGLKIYQNNSFASDKSCELQYANNRRLKSHASKFNLSCEL
ncbi:MAG TPA: hypothetical protein VI461_01550 [Chitinophagaceae bacterium]|nr:hypothetical protein [Chitinophagaceae bacterium]